MHKNNRLERKIKLIYVSLVFNALLCISMKKSQPQESHAEQTDCRVIFKICCYDIMKKD